MRALTIRQPWASLIAVGAKTIETRGWSTTYRGPLLIHAAKRTPDDLAVLDPIFTALEAAGVDPRAVLDRTGERWVERGIDSPRTWGKPMPLGAVVATCTLADVVPIVDDRNPLTTILVPPSIRVVRRVRGHPDRLWYFDGTDKLSTNVDGQRPYGDFTPGRYAWLLADVRPLTSPVPAKGRQGLWTPDADLIAAVEADR